MGACYIWYVHMKSLHNLNHWLVGPVLSARYGAVMVVGVTDGALYSDKASGLGVEETNETKRKRDKSGGLGEREGGRGGVKRKSGSK